jgi:two-component system KDP operon response regulator KdpE
MAHAIVLLVADEPELVGTLEVACEAQGFEVLAVSTGRSALDQVTLDEPDVVLLDLVLPDMDGLDVCRRLRQHSRVPIVAISADDTEDRKVAVLDAGADDYVTKPFSVRELLARTRVALRHRRALESIVVDDDIVVGALVIDAAGHRAAVSGNELELRPKEFALLTLLARNAGKVLTYRILLEHVWGPSHTLETLRTHVSLLRRKLGDHPDAPPLTTEPGVGYRLLRPDQL